MSEEITEQKKDHLVEGLFMTTMFANLSDSTATAFGGLVGLGIVLICLAWLVFPFVVMSKLDKIHRTLQGMSAKLPTAASAKQPPPVTPAKTAASIPTAPERINLDR